MATIARVRAVISGASGLPGLFTAYFKGTTAVPSSAEANDMGARVRAYWQQLHSDLAAGTTVQVDGTVDTLDDVSGTLTGRAGMTSVPAVVTSSGTGELPPATAAGLRYITTTIFGTRILQGRSFVSPLALASSTSGQPSSGLVADLNAAGPLLATGATAVTHAVWHRPSASHTGGGSATVTGYSADSGKLWVLRSRRD